MSGGPLSRDHPLMASSRNGMNRISGLRLLLCSNHLVPDAGHLLGCPARQQRNSERDGDAMSDRRAAQRIVECCAQWPPRVLIHDRADCYGVTFERRLRHLGIEQVRTPFRAPRANAISTAECLSVWMNITGAALPPSKAPDPAARGGNQDAV
jgi:hypothetical protein